MDTRSARTASLGKLPPKVTPGSRVFISPVALRMPSGADIFGSKVSIWLGPPCRKRKMTEQSRTGCRASAARARAASSPGSVRPPRVRLPIWRKARRSQR
jgi:hypothetical protein